MTFGSYGYRDPRSSPRTDDPIAVLEVVLAELDNVEQHEQVRLVNLVEEPKPGKVLGLMNGNDQGHHPQWMGRVCVSPALERGSVRSVIPPIRLTTYAG